MSSVRVCAIAVAPTASAIRAMFLVKAPITITRYDRRMLRSSGVICVGVACLLLASQAPGQTIFRNARLITGDGSVIEDSAFVVDGTQFTWAGRRAEAPAVASATIVDLKGKTVMPAKVDLHGHIGFQHDVDGTMAKDYYTRDNLVDHLKRLAYYGFSA